MATEAFTKRNTFHVNINWEPGASASTAKHVQDQMYVESLEPLNRTEEYPLILIHGDYHSSQIWLTKPDLQPGWASYFLNRGYHVYLVDLPGTGRSNFLRQSHLKYSELQSVPASQVQRDLTIPKRYLDRVTRTARWPSINRHDKWPGAGTRGDLIFDRYCASLTSMCFSFEERQTLAQNALTSLLQVAGKSVLIGEGTGATMAWLAADVAPNLVAGVVAIEPPGPPFCKIGPSSPNNQHDTFTEYDPKRLRYGLAGIPLTYDPPARAPQEICDNAPCLDLALYQNTGNGKKMILQYNGDKSPRGFTFLDYVTKRYDSTSCVRKLTHLQKMRHVLFTAEASSHSTFDISTLHFMKQAGLEVDCGFLTEYSTFGNGHLMFLETNSDNIAALVIRWINKRVPKRGDTDFALPLSVKPVATTSTLSSRDLEAQPNAPLQCIVDAACPTISQLIDLTAEFEPTPSTDCRDSEPMDICQSEDTPVMTASTALPPLVPPLSVPPTDCHCAVPTLPKKSAAITLSGFVTLPDIETLPENQETISLSDFVTIPDDSILPEAPVPYDGYHTPSPSMATGFPPCLPFPSSAATQEPLKRVSTFERTPWRLERQRRKENRRPRRGNTKRYDSMSHGGQNYPRSGYFPPTQHLQPPPLPLPMMNQGNHYSGLGSDYLWPPQNGQQASYPNEQTSQRKQDIQPYNSPSLKKDAEGTGFNFHMPHVGSNSHGYNCFPTPPPLNHLQQQAWGFRAPGYPPPQWRG